MINTPDVWKAYAKAHCENGAPKVPFSMYEKQLQQESGWEHFLANGNVKSSPSGSMGLGQLNSKFYSSELWSNPITNLDTSIEIMRHYYVAYGSWRKALAAYNWGPGYVGGGTFDDGKGAGRVQHSAWDGSLNWHCSGCGAPISSQAIHYLDVILGPGWPEPEVLDAVTPIVPIPEVVVPVNNGFGYSFGIADLANKLGADTVGKPLTAEEVPTEYTFQFTDKGLFVYSKTANQTHFFPQAQQ